MRRKVILTMFAILLGIAGYAGIRITQESFVGTGPVKTALAPEGPSREIAIVANAVDGVATLIDVQSQTIIAVLDLTPDGKKVGLFRDPMQSLLGQPFMERRSGKNYAQDTDISPDGKVLYVARGHLGDVAAINIATGELMWRIAVAGVRADHMAISPDGARLFVSALTKNCVIVIDTAKARKVGSFVSGVWPHDNHVSKDGKLIFNASLGDMRKEVTVRDDVEEATVKNGYAYQLTLSDAHTLEILDRYRFESGIRPFAVTSDNKKIFAQLSNTHAIIKYELEKRQVTDRIDLPVAEGVTKDDWDFEAPHHGLALSPDESTLCVAGRASDYAGIVRTDGLELIEAVSVGDAPSWAVIDKKGENCILANTRSDDVSIVSLSQRKETARIRVGDYPKHITLGDIPDSVLTGMTNRPKL